MKSNLIRLSLKLFIIKAYDMKYVEILISKKTTNYISVYAKHHLKQFIMTSVRFIFLRNLFHQKYN